MKPAHRKWAQADPSTSLGHEARTGISCAPKKGVSKVVGSCVTLEKFLREEKFRRGWAGKAGWGGAEPEEDRGVSKRTFRWFAKQCVRWPSLGSPSYPVNPIKPMSIWCE